MMFYSLKLQYQLLAYTLGSFDTIVCFSKLQTLRTEFLGVKIAQIHEFYKIFKLQMTQILHVTYCQNEIVYKTYLTFKVFFYVSKNIKVFVTIGGKYIHKNMFSIVIKCYKTISYHFYHFIIHIYVSIKIIIRLKQII